MYTVVGGYMEPVHCQANSASHFEQSHVELKALLCEKFKRRKKITWRTPQLYSAKVTFNETNVVNKLDTSNNTRNKITSNLYLQDNKTRIVSFTFSMSIKNELFSHAILRP